MIFYFSWEREWRMDSGEGRGGRRVIWARVREAESVYERETTPKQEFSQPLLHPGPNALPERQRARDLLRVSVELLSSEPRSSR